MQFSFTVDPQVLAKKTQQTPNPAAQFPSEVPDFELHSEDVKQVPYIEVSDLAVHWLK